MLWAGQEASMVDSSERKWQVTRLLYVDDTALVAYCREEQRNVV